MTKEEMQRAIGQMSYYNAAEGSWSKEASTRNAFRKDIAQRAIDSGLSYEQFEELYNSCDSLLTNFSDFGYSYKIIMKNKRKD